MKTTLVFPSYMHLAGFVSVADNGNINIDLHTKSLTADFHHKDVQTATQAFSATVLEM
jgi:hypothetical protein